MPRTIKECRNGQYRYRVTGRNNEKMATSEQYTRETSAKRGFYDLADECIRILFDEGKLRETLERLGLIQEAQEESRV